MPTNHPPFPIEYGPVPTKVTVKKGDTFQFITPIPGVFRFRYTAGRPYQSGMPLLVDHPGGDEREATIVGVFPFRCTINGNPFEGSDGSIEGVLEVEPNP